MPAPPALTNSNAVTDSDHGAVVRVAAGFCAAVMLFFLSARLFVRWPWRNLFGKDDAAAIVASVGLAFHGR